MVALTSAQSSLPVRLIGFPYMPRAFYFQLPHIRYTVYRVQDPLIFALYESLLNDIRKVCVMDSFEVLRAYAQDLQLDEPMASDIEKPPAFTLAGESGEKRRVVAEWELEILAREVIINGNLLGPCDRGFKQLKYFAGAVNTLKKLEEEIAALRLHPQNVVLEMFRIAHRQFPWQSSGPSHQALNRYFRIYSFPSLDKLVAQEIGLSTLELYRAFLVLFALFVKSLRIPIPIPDTAAVGVHNSHVEIFLSRFTRPFDELRKSLIDEQQFDDDYAYHFSSLRALPVIKMNIRREFYACPFPTLLFWRVTGGLFFDLIHVKGFDNAYGQAFENYVGDVIAATNVETAFRVYPEERFGKEHKRTVDWVIADSTAAIFLECKTKRVPLSAKTRLDVQAVDLELDRMAEIIVQVYKTIRDYRANLYPSFKSDPNLQVFPVVVTLEEGYWFGNSIATLDRKITAGLKEAHIPDSWLDAMPYVICSIDELERMLQIVRQVGMANFITRKVRDPDKRLWNLDAFMRESFPAECQKLQMLFNDVQEVISPDIR